MMAMGTRVIGMMSGRRCMVVRSPYPLYGAPKHNLIGHGRAQRLPIETPPETHSETDLSLRVAKAMQRERTGSRHPCDSIGCTADALRVSCGILGIVPLPARAGRTVHRPAHGCFRRPGPDTTVRSRAPQCCRG